MTADMTYVRCACCGEQRAESEVARMACHPDVAICGGCVDWMSARMHARPKITPIFPVRGSQDATTATIDTRDPLAVAAVEAIHAGDVRRLRELLAEHPTLATARLGDDDPEGMSRTLLHVVTDWPGHFPNGADTVRALVEAGADVNARFRGPHEETPLHWAASSNDVAVLDALLDLGADIEAPGAVIAGGTPLADARAFGNWAAGLRLVERGARTTLTDSRRRWG